MKRNKLNKKLFAKFYWGLATKSEEKQVFESDESVKMLQNQWDNVTEKNREKYGEINHSKIKSEIYQNIERMNKESKFRKMNQWIKYAAAILIPLFMASIVYYLTIDDSRSRDNLVWIEKQSKRGERKKLQLPDGSMVWLNSETKISYPENFEGDERNLKLDGEAYFEVTHNEEKPFIVNTGGIDIKVLGTSFNVRSYNREKAIETTLVEGKVSVQRTNPKTKKTRRAILSPNQQAKFFKTTEEFLLDKVSAEKFVSWRNGKLIIEGRTFKELIEELERWYNVDISLQDNLSEKYSYTITITDESLEDVMKLIKRTTPTLTIKFENNKVFITEK
jgi:transmembrane sensor